MESTSDMIFMDSHCHLQFFTLEELKIIIEECKKHHINFLLTNSTSLDDFAITEQISKNDSVSIIPSYGYHPWYLKDLYKSFNDKSSLYTNFLIDFEQFINAKNKLNIPFSIGEIGIDNLFPIKDVPLDFQKDIFIKQLTIAEKYSLLTTIHCVRAWDDLYKVLKDFFDNSKSNNLIDKKLLLLHSYGGNTQQAKKFAKSFNCWFSISSGCFTERNYSMLKSLPIDNMIFESDSPSMFNKDIYEDNKEYLNYFKEENGKYKNSPLSIIQLSKKIADLRSIKYDELIKSISVNNKQLLKGIINLIK